MCFLTFTFTFLFPSSWHFFISLCPHSPISRSSLVFIPFLLCSLSPSPFPLLPLPPLFLTVTGRSRVTFMLAVVCAVNVLREGEWRGRNILCDNYSTRVLQLDALTSSSSCFFVIAKNVHVFSFDSFQSFSISSQVFACPALSSTCLSAEF